MFQSPIKIGDFYVGTDLFFRAVCPPSIFGTNELNYRVRDGNGWTLIVISTDCTVMKKSLVFEEMTCWQYLRSKW